MDRTEQQPISDTEREAVLDLLARCDLEKLAAFLAPFKKMRAETISAREWYNMDRTQQARAMREWKSREKEKRNG